MANMGVLQLEGEHELQLFKRNEHYDLVDALAYVDPLDEMDASEAKRMIASEMKEMVREKDSSGISQNLDMYVEALPMPKSSSSSLIEAEMQRASKILQAKKFGQNIPCEGPHLDMMRYNEIDAPSEDKANNLAEWKQAVERAQVLLEHSSNSMTNLKLMDEHCQKIWLKHIADISVLHTSLTHYNKTLTKEIEQTNKQRKLDQVTCGNELRSLTKTYEEYRERNERILVAIGALEGEIEELSSSLN